jgi:hypothetical protein
MNTEIIKDGNSRGELSGVVLMGEINVIIIESNQWSSSLLNKLVEMKLHQLLTVNQK